VQYIENKTFDEIRIGDHAEIVRTLEKGDIDLFAAMSGDVNPEHLDPEFAKDNKYHKVIGHGMWGGSLFSAVLGTQLPGPGTIYVAQSLYFKKPVGLGDQVRARVTVRSKDDVSKQVIFDCAMFDKAGDLLIFGDAVVTAPTRKVRRPRAALPEITIHDQGQLFRGFIDAARRHEPVRIGVVHPCDAVSLTGAVDAWREGLIAPVLVGPRARIEAVARDAGLSIEEFAIEDAPHSHAAAARAVEMVREGRIDALMKGSLHTDELMAAVVSSQTGLRTERRLSHVFVFDVPHYSKPLMITDAAINIYPTLEDKRDIIQNAIDLAQALSIQVPKVAILSAVETINPKLASTIEAAALCKMADRGQITGGLLEGPLAFDNAISREAAKTKKIDSAVAGDADILVAPDLEAGNMIAKQLVYLAGADCAGIVIGARVPIVLTSRADGALARVTSCALAQLLHHRARAVRA
jgi:phosphate acetyltransferase